MQSTPISSSAAAAIATPPAASLTSLPATPNTAPFDAPIFPTLSPGHQSSEFYLALLVVASIVAALWAGKLDSALASALLGLIVSGYPTLRTWLKAQHVDAMADVLAASIKNGGGAVALGALAGAVRADNVTIRQSDNETTAFPAAASGSGAPSRRPLPEASPRPPAGALGESALPQPGAAGFVTVKTLATVALISALALLALAYFTGCAGAPYYVSGITGTLDTSKDGSRIRGGGVQLAISPNPHYPPPKDPGFAK